MMQQPCLKSVYEERIFYLTTSLAESGDVDAQLNLGVMYDTGQGAPLDHREAARWYRLAAEQGDADAQFSLGVMYDKGRSVPQNYVEAHKRFNLAAAQGLEPAQKNPVLIVAAMTGEQVAEARRLVREWRGAATHAEALKRIEDDP